MPGWYGLAPEGVSAAGEQGLPAEKGALEVGVGVVLLLLDGVAEGEDFGLIDRRGGGGAVAAGPPRAAAVCGP